MPTPLLRLSLLLFRFPCSPVSLSLSLSLSLSSCFLFFRRFSVVVVLQLHIVRSDFLRVSPFLSAAALGPAAFWAMCSEKTRKGNEKLAAQLPTQTANTLQAQKNNTKCNTNTNNI